MRWFMHLTASGHDPDIGAIVAEFGFKGYYLFFRTLEIMSTEFKIENPGENHFNFQWFLGEFSRKIDRKTLLNFLDFTNSLGRISYALNGTHITLNCDKLKDLTDEYTKKRLKETVGKPKRKSGVTPDECRDTYNKNKKESKNKDKEKEREPSCPNIYSDEHLELAGLLESKIKEKLPKHKFKGNYIESWANTARLMIERDKLTIEEIKDVITWASQDDFWYKNILSMDKLREKFGVLWENMRQSNVPKKKYNPITGVWQ